ncbi:Phosphoenolpyruvate-protein phosphotransferase [Candidatus Hydrogenisulfobacillus filiaventi]|uniref:Phosphoenolpyruvate-protein phosphotransferase n=1 Tax=Candidatus Hydrogenisulfobacillus filiaventi TaxID=2707344 RepID=A0A6F8ZD31_9FIRM|nr:Phosphoenolpyruvate-protein phosphotransferase [Candidatus Hydrogenisulfobacillus filiaventi]
MSTAPFRGIAIQPGLATGPAWLPAAPAAGPGPAGTPAEEEARWEQARQTVAAHLAALARREAGTGREMAEAQRLMALDPSLDRQVRDGVRQGRSAPEALQAAAAGFAGALRRLPEPYWQQRAADVEAVAGLLQRALAGAAPETVPAGAVVCAGDLGPAWLLERPPGTVAALALAEGGPASHLAILVRALDLPAVFGLGPAFLAAVRPGSQVWVEGGEGLVWVDPDPATRRLLEARRQAAARPARAPGPARTRDGTRITVLANLNRPEEAAAAFTAGAEGIGLLRTEFLWEDTDDPPEEVQFQAYLAVARQAGSRPVTIRTFDYGGDKSSAAEPNPFLGLRGIRLGFRHPARLLIQFRAILRAAAAGPAPLRVMLPMVSTVEEVEAARAIWEEARRQVPAAPPVAFGIMVETPAAALTAAALAVRADFFSIGSNDLVQYTLAVDRGNPAVAGLYQPQHPAVLRLIREVSRAAGAAGIAAGICGEMGGDPAAAALLIGLGLREFSMSPSRLPAFQGELSRFTVTDAEALATTALAAAGPDQVKRLVDDFRRAHSAP